MVCRLAVSWQQEFCDPVYDLTHSIVTVKTDYPFGSTLIYEVTSSAPFTFYIRIPSWAQLTSTIAVNGGDASALSPDTSSSLQSVRVGAGITSVELFLDMQTEIEQRSNGSIAVYRGPLLYAVDLGHNDTTTLAMRCVSSVLVYGGPNVIPHCQVFRATGVPGDVAECPGGRPYIGTYCW